jgi:hypothetical protein
MVEALCYKAEGLPDEVITFFLIYLTLPMAMWFTRPRTKMSKVIPVTGRGGL